MRRMYRVLLNSVAHLLIETGVFWYCSYFANDFFSLLCQLFGVSVFYHGGQFLYPLYVHN
jgi:hypothetical protein